MHHLLGNHAFFWLLWLCMSFHFLPRDWHETLGVLILAPFCYHLWRYRGWWQALCRGKTLQPPASRLGSLLNLLLLVLMLAVVLSGAMISNYLFKDILPLAWRMSITAHQVHKSLCFVLWIVTGLHVGLHLEAWLHRHLTSPLGRRLTPAAAVLVSALGVYSSMLHRIGDRLLLKHIFATPALKNGPLTYLGGLLAVFGLYLAVGWVMQRFCRGKKD